MVKDDAFAASCDWADSDVVFANSTCFSSAMFDGFRAKCRLLKPGAFVVCTTSRMGDDEYYELLETGRERCWVACLFMVALALFPSLEPHRSSSNPS